VDDNVHPDAVRAIEAVVMVSPEPVEPQLLAQLLEVPVATVEALCQRLAQTYEEAGHGLEGQSARLSAAALETLAIVAYKQPVSRAQVAAIRGVDPEGVMRTLQARGYITEVARDPGPGQAVLWGTTPLFLEKLGLNSLADLPPLADFVPGADVLEALEEGLRVTPPDGA